MIPQGDNMTMTKEEYRKDFESMGGKSAFDTARDVLSLLADWLREYEPHATESIKVLDDVLFEIPLTLKELIGE